MRLGRRSPIPAALLASCLLASPLAGAAAEEPALPAGLETPREEPALPAGLESPGSEPELPQGLESGQGGPPLPAGLGGPAADGQLAAGRPDRAAIEFGGFLESRLGYRSAHDPLQSGRSIGEARLQARADTDLDSVHLRLAADLVYDRVEENRSHLDLEHGNGWLDLREVWMSLRPLPNADLKLGRQVLTWGTGDLVFINDLFPKDWNAFLVGRDVEYLKAPSDALRLALFLPLLNLDLVYTPRFDADRFIDGRRVSYFSPASGASAGRATPLEVERPDAWFRDEEMALRLYRNVAAWELAVYAYRGYWKSPGGFDPASARGIFPRLDVLGASLRGPVAGGIGNLEAGYYDSRDDRSGADPFVNNSEWRFLAGFEREVVPELTLGLQYYVERLQDYGAYRRTLPAGFARRDEDRHLATLRLTRLLLNQNLQLSLFAFWSPSDHDRYVRPSVLYKWNDQLRLEAGANLFGGRHEYSFFGQFTDASNVYAGFRYGF